jgi:NAD(P)-dependent dehydrogenase (short-subunit alcohol dehydrogenase family)
VSRILVIGGYGGFGARLCRRLSASGHEVLVGGRSAEKASAVAAELRGAEPVCVDRTGDVGSVLTRFRPHLVIDAAGPFQNSGYPVPPAGIKAGVHYLDLADARDFVCGIGSLDKAARLAGVAVVRGASSVPALSGAVARQVCEGMDRVSLVEIAISASNQASAGASVAAAILKLVGQPVRLWRGRRWHSRSGWQEQRSIRFAIAGAAPIDRRLVALCDVPDHDLLPPMLAGRPAVAFRAGTELRFQMWALWLASWPVRWRWLRSLSGLARWLRPLQRLTPRLGTDRSAMAVTARRWRRETPVARRWTLVAERGDGPEHPTLAAALLADDVLAGRVPAGARDAADLLSLDRFAPLFTALEVGHEIIELPVPAPLYQRVMGERFAELPPLVRAIHLVHGDGGAAAEAEMRRGRTFLARLAARTVRFPPAGRYPLHVDFSEAGGVERWTRHFERHSFRSELKELDGALTERFGPLRFRFELPSSAHGLTMELTGWSCWGVKLPLALAPRVGAREWEEDGRFRFDARIALPLAGEVIEYSGWLRPMA